MSFLNGLNPKEFLNTHQEWHALIEGFCDGFFPLGIKYKPSKALQEDIESEHHYYNPARIAGIVSFVLFVVGIYKLVA